MRPGRCRLLGLAIELPQPTLDPAAARLARIAATCLAVRGTECRVCGEHCDTGAIRFRLEAEGIARPHIDATACTGCGACAPACPADAIALRPVGEP